MRSRTYTRIAPLSSGMATPQRQVSEHKFCFFSLFIFCMLKIYHVSHCRNVKVIIVLSITKLSAKFKPIKYIFSTTPFPILDRYEYSKTWNFHEYNSVM